jgi:SAM-dependent methyltransferase
MTSNNKLTVPKKNDKKSWTDFFNTYIENNGMGSYGGDYAKSHLVRYVETVFRIPPAQKPEARVLEIGSLTVFQELLRSHFGYPEVHGTDFDGPEDKKSYYRELNLISSQPWYMTHRVNIENEALPFPDGYLDTVIMCEVIEHMELDPMFAIAEINRVLAPGGKLLISTPNSASGRVLWSILNGYRPHFFMQYNKERMLYKHNFEYDVAALRNLLESGGFGIERIETLDCFAPPEPEALAALAKLGMPTTDRGDNIFALAVKNSGVINRYPKTVYY